MTEFEKLQNKADECLKTTKATFVRENEISPFILGIPENDVPVFHDIDVSNQEEIQKIPDHLKRMTLKYNALIVVIKVYVNDMDKKDVEDSREHIKNLEDHPETSCAVFCFLYTKDKAMSRHFRYDPDTFAIYYQSKWENLKVDQTKMFMNPFDQIDITELI